MVQSAEGEGRREEGVDGTGGEGEESQYGLTRRVLGVDKTDGMHMLRGIKHGGKRPEREKGGRGEEGSRSTLRLERELAHIPGVLFLIILN